jgi:hypothetical protein
MNSGTDCYIELMSSLRQEAKMYILEILEKLRTDLQLKKKKKKKKEKSDKRVMLTWMFVLDPCPLEPLRSAWPPYATETQTFRARS